MATKEKKPMRTLEEVLESLKAAEKEYAQKCEEYGISEKANRKKKSDIDKNVTQDNPELNKSETIDVKLAQSQDDNLIKEESM